jgi:hypothetical protein
MAFIDIPTEQTTAATDLVLALVAALCAFSLRSLRKRDPFKVDIWTSTFTLIAVAAALGAVAHGFEMEERMWDLVWQPLNLCLGLAVGFFCVGAFYDSWGRRLAKRALLPMICLGVLFYVATTLIDKGFLVFVVYEAVAMITALALYLRLAAGRRLPGALLMAVGVTVTILAAGVQAGGAVRFVLVWEFDHNGAFHLIQIVGILLLWMGIRAALKSATEIESRRWRAGGVTVE